MANGFYSGRNGSDQLSVFLVAVALVAAVAASVISTPSARYVVSVIAIALIGWAFFRMMSKNTAKRREENDTFLSFFKANPDKKREQEEKRRIKEARKEDEKTHAYFKCPECKGECRVPKGKGKISITCPRCGHKFIKRT